MQIIQISKTKFCLKCKNKKPIEYFPTGKSPCKICKRNKTKLRTTNTIKHPNITSFINYLLQSTRKNLKKRKLTYSIDFNTILELLIKQKGLCALSNIKLTYNSKHENKYNLSIDRIDSSKGYHPENIQLVCNIVNRMKWTLFNEDFIALCTSISDFKKGKEGGL